MDYDVLESVSQGSDGAQDAENSRIAAIADELRRRSKLYEAQHGDGQPHVSPFEIEQRITESFAKEHGLWIPIDAVFDLGTPGPSGNENDTYVSNDIIYKVNNLLNSGSILRLLDKVRMHNEIFPDTCYRLHAFTGFDGRTVMPILKQAIWFPNLSGNASAMSPGNPLKQSVLFVGKEYGRLPACRGIVRGAISKPLFLKSLSYSKTAIPKAESHTKEPTRRPQILTSTIKSSIVLLFFFLMPDTLHFSALHLPQLYRTDAQFRQ